MGNILLVTVLLMLGGCHLLAPVEAPTNSCKLINTEKHSGGMMPRTVEEFNQCQYRCHNGTTRNKTGFGSCPTFISF